MTVGPSDDGIDPFAWNAVPYEAGLRLLRRWVATEAVPEPVVDLWASALTAVKGASELLSDDGYQFAVTIAATIRPFGLGVSPVAHEALSAIFEWGGRRVLRDRRVRDSLPDVLRRCVEAHRELAALAGEDPGQAALVEETAQAEDVRRVRTGEGT